ncbi:MAG: hypothetical protein HY314_14595 [Acidobacteria bacterium]|nr:hypothetical protein [Acidobacteriota bacterium]
MTKRKKFSAKQLRHDPFQDWYAKQAERAQQYREPIRRTLILIGVIIVLAVGSSLGYSYWKGTAEKRLGEALDILNARVTDTPPTNAIERTYNTEEEKYRAAVDAFKRVSTVWYYKFTDYSRTAKYYEGACQLHLNPSEGQAMLERLAQGNSMTARLARLALVEHFIANGDAARAETLYRQLVDDPGPLPKPQLQLGLARALELQGKKSDAINLYLQIAKERAEEQERTEAVARLVDLDPKALDQLPEKPASSTPPDALARYKKK